MRTKYLLKLKNIVGTVSNIIFFTKEYFPSDSFALTSTWRTSMTFSWFRRSIKGHNYLIPEWTRWMAKNSCSSSFAIYWTCRDIWWSFFFCCEAFFLYEVAFGFSSQDFPLWIFLISEFFFFLKEDTSIYRWR